jgi:hypothetical protein
MFDEKPEMARVVVCCGDATLGLNTTLGFGVGVIVAVGVGVLVFVGVIVAVGVGVAVAVGCGVNVTPGSGVFVGVDGTAVGVGLTQTSLAAYTDPTAFARDAVDTLF